MADWTVEDRAVLGLQRNRTSDGTCKYAVIRLDKLRDAAALPGNEVAQNVLHDLVAANRGADPKWVTIVDMLPYVELGTVGDPEENFVIKLKDENAAFALDHYANAARSNGQTKLADDVQELAERSRAMQKKRAD